MLNPNLVYLAIVISLVGDIAYAIDTLRGNTKPNRVTWLLWSLAPLIAFFAELTEGVGVQSLLTFIIGFGPLIVFFTSFLNKKSYWKITKFDIFCGFLSFMAIILWVITKTGIIAIILSILSDVLAAIPTYKKAIFEPETESSSAFLFGALSSLITLLTIQVWNFATYAFPVYFFILCFSIFLLVNRAQKLQFIKS